MTKTTFKMGMETKISFAIALAKVWQKEFRILTFNTLFSIVMKMDDMELLKYCRLYSLLGDKISHQDKEKVTAVAEEDLTSDI